MDTCRRALLGEIGLVEGKQEEVRSKKKAFRKEVLEVVRVGKS